jgi:uncharacterized protein
MRRKLATFDRVKVLPEEEGQGVFEAVVAVFDNVDLVGDRIKKGAFTKSLAKWEESGDPIPVIFSHQWDDINAHVGEVIEAKETDEGLYVKGQLDMDDEFGAKVFHKLRKRRIKEFSFAYDVIEEDQKDDANELIELEIIEVGPTLKGANPETRLIGVKAGRVLSAKNETKIQDAKTLLEEVLATLGAAAEDDEKVDGEAVDTSTSSDEEKALGEAVRAMTPSSVQLLADIKQAQVA